MNLSDVFKEISKQMQADFERARKLLTHSGLKGNSAENILREFLRKYLPKTLDLSKGVIIDSEGKSSKETDVIISDTQKTPILFESGENRVVPVECVYAVIEVKSNLDNKELERIFENMTVLKSLRKKAFYIRRGQIQDVYYLYGKEWNYWPINYFVFAYNSIDLLKLYSQIETYHNRNQLPVEARIDMICILNKGVFINCSTDSKNVSALPEQGTRLVPYETNNALLMFYTMISHFLNQAGMPNFRFKDYLGKIVF